MRPIRGALYDQEGSTYLAAWTLRAILTTGVWRCRGVLSYA